MVVVVMVRVLMMSPEQYLVCVDVLAGGGVADHPPARDCRPHLRGKRQRPPPQRRPPRGLWVRSHFRFRNRGAEYVKSSAYGIKWLSGRMCMCHKIMWDEDE